MHIVFDEQKHLAISIGFMLYWLLKLLQPPLNSVHFVRRACFGDIVTRSAFASRFLCLGGSGNIKFVFTFLGSGLKGLGHKLVKLYKAVELLEHLDPFIRKKKGKEKRKTLLFHLIFTVPQQQPS